MLGLQYAPLPDVGDPLAVPVEALPRYLAFALDHPNLHRFMFATKLSPGRIPLPAHRLLAAVHGSLLLQQTGWTADAPTSVHTDVISTMLGLRPGT